jgi:1-acyl-sn-glycerol-3-phosphate acyltransferase
MYRAAMAACRPVVRGWGRLSVSGLEHLPAAGPVLLAVNHDSHWDPVAVGVAARERRQIRALAKASLWRTPLLGRVLDGMGQIPLHRGGGPDGGPDGGIAVAARELRAGACLGIFPEGTLSFGHPLRAHAGIGRLAEAVPEAAVVCCAVVDTVAIARFPRRPRIRVRFFPPAAGRLRPGESAAAFSERLLAEIRAEAPVVAAGRDPVRKHRAAGERRAAAELG